MPFFGSGSAPRVFPEVRATTLNGDDLTLPADLPAEVSLVVVLFRDELDPLADQWARLGHSIEEQYPGRFAVVETPVVGRGMTLFGALATVGIRGQVEGEQEHTRTLPIYVEKKAFRKALGLSKEGEVYPLLVHRATGQVLWSGRGAMDMREVQDLETAITEALDPPDGPPPSTEAGDASAPT
ncbi:MAG: hypothetical protein AAF791_06000 [Bacteroidota bacterium]